MLRHRVCFLNSRGAWVLAATLVTMSCSGPTPSEQAISIAPSPSVTAPAAADTDRSLPASPRDATTFPLENGTFVIRTAAGDSLTGIALGNLAIPVPGRSTISVGLLATGGSGIFSGASGILTGDGGGTFEVGNEGKITVSSATGVLQTNAQPAGFKFGITIGGTALLSCSASAKIQLTIRGEGSIASVGRASVLLISELGNTSCVS